LPRAPRRPGRPAVAQKYEVHQKTLFKKSEFFFPEGPCENVFPGSAEALDGCGVGEKSVYSETTLSVRESD